MYTHSRTRGAERNTLTSIQRNKRTSSNEVRVRAYSPHVPTGGANEFTTPPWVFSGTHERKARLKRIAPYMSTRRHARPYSRTQRRTRQETRTATHPTVWRHERSSVQHKARAYSDMNDSAARHKTAQRQALEWSSTPHTSVQRHAHERTVPHTTVQRNARACSTTYEHTVPRTIAQRDTGAYNATHERAAQSTSV